jgi:chaperonin GroES
MAMQVREVKNFPWPKASNVKFPLLTVAAIQFQARAYPAIVDGSNLVKGRVLGPDPDGMKRKRADRIGAHMTWQMLYRMPDWEEETDRLLLQLPITGCVFRKAYYDSIVNTNCAEMVSGEDFIINYWATSLERAPRYTHRLRFYPHEVKEKIAAGLWREVPMQAEAEDSNDDDAKIEFYEQHRYIDLDGDGYPEPFIVTATKDGAVARIVPCFGADDVRVSVQGKVVKATELQGAKPEKIVQIERRQYFTKYSFIPAPDGSFYDIGFGWLLEDISEPVNTAINQMLDAATLQNAAAASSGSTESTFAAGPCRSGSASGSGSRSSTTRRCGTISSGSTIRGRLRCCSSFSEC